MRRIEFDVLPGVGPDSERQSGTPVDLLRAIPYLLAMGLLPPLPVVNDILARGEMDAGMSGGARWEPFALGPDEWADVKQALEDDGVQSPAVPDWVQTMGDWPIWVMERRFGVPADQHRQLADRAEKLRSEREAARDDESRYLELHVAASRAEEELAQFVSQYIRTSRP
jgi:hypothetical protein